MTNQYNADSYVPKPSPSTEWRPIVGAALESLEGQAVLSELFAKIEQDICPQVDGPWQGKVWETLEFCEEFERVKPGIWRIRVKGWVHLVRRALRLK